MIKASQARLQSDEMSPKVFDNAKKLISGFIEDATKRGEYSIDLHTQLDGVNPEMFLYLKEKGYKLIESTYSQYVTISWEKK